MDFPVVPHHFHLQHASIQHHATETYVSVTRSPLQMPPLISSAVPETNTSDGIIGPTIHSGHTTATSEASACPDVPLARELRSSLQVRTQVAQGSDENSAPVTTESETTRRPARTPDTGFCFEFRAYPYPPPRRPLCRPLPPSAASGLCVRQRLLRRWRSNHNQSRTDNTRLSLPTSRTMTCRTDSLSRHPPRKRIRSPFLRHVCPLSTNAGVVMAVANTCRRDSVNECPYTGLRPRKRARYSPRPAVIEESDLSVAECASRVDLSQSDQKRVNQPFYERVVTKTDERKSILLARVDELRRRKTWMEEAEIDEIVRLSKGKECESLFRTGKECSHLKTDLEALKPRAVRCAVRLLLRRMDLKGLDVPFELEVHLELLPAQVVRELQTLVNSEKGMIEILSSRQLECVLRESKRVRTELQVLVDRETNLDRCC